MRETRKRSSSAFTLIELLVVISIIALLIGILLPALSAARRVARTSQSASNQRQIGIAMYTYQADNKEFYPLWQNPPDGNDPTPTTPPNGGWYWTTRLAVDNYVPGLDVYADPGFDADTSFLDDGVEKTSMHERVFNRIHYGYNYVWVGANLAVRSNTRDANSTRPNAPFDVPARVTDMQDPTAVIVTCAVKNWNPPTNITPPIDPGTQVGAHVFIDYPFAVSNAGTPHARHGNAVQISWADGHVSAIPMPFTQQEQDADTGGGLANATANGVYGNNALGSAAAGGPGGRGGGAKGNYFDLKASTPDDDN